VEVPLGGHGQAMLGLRMLDVQLFMFWQECWAGVLGFYSLDKWQAKGRRERRKTTVCSPEKIDEEPE